MLKIDWEGLTPTIIGFCARIKEAHMVEADKWESMEKAVGLAWDKLDPAEKSNIMDLLKRAYSPDQVTGDSDAG